MVLISLTSSLATSGTSSDFTTEFDPPIYLDGTGADWEIALVSAELPKTYYNISSEFQNNKLYVGNGVNDYTLTIPDGNYSISSLNDIIQADHDIGGGHFIIEPNSASFHVKYAGTDNWYVDFTHDDTFRDIIGANADIYNLSGPTVYYDFENKPDVTKSNDHFHIAVDCVDGRYARLSSSKANIIYSFNYSVDSGSAEIIAPYQRIYLPMNKVSISSINVKLLNQLGHVVNLNNESMTVNLNIRKRYDRNE